MDSERTQRHQLLATTLESSWGIVLLTLAVIGLYLLLHPYLGITHDARLYSLQALTQLRPDLYGNDIFLRYGSQDDYTFFTSLYALVISWLGVEPAAALLTFLSQLAFLLAALLLARRLLPTHLALFALSLLVLLPNHYGSGRIFTYLEEFITPRQLAEALVLFGLVAWLTSWRKLAAAFMTCAMLTHPIMGLSGLVLLVSLSLVIPHWRKVFPLALFAVLLIVIAVSAGLMPAHWRLDDEWLAIVLGRAEYLSLMNWSTDDWGRVVTVIATLVVAAQVLRGDMQRLAIAVLLSTGGLMLLALIGGDFLRISLVVQAQPWRALWLATVVAILLLPALFIECWRAKNPSRCGALLLAAAWLMPSENIALLIAPLAIAAACGPIKIDEQRSRILLWGSWLVLALSIVAALGVAMLAWSAGTYNIAVSPVLDLLRGVSTGGATTLIVLFGVYYAASQVGHHAKIGLAVSLALLVVAAAVPTAATWFSIQYDGELKAAFGDWRARIPPGSDVMWAADASMGADGAVSAWLLLERPSYISRIQATTSLFSRPAALEIQRRTQSMLGLLPDVQSLYSKNAEIVVPKSQTLSKLCQASSVRYVVTGVSFDDATPIAAPPHIRNPFRNLKLYICP